MSTFGKIVAGVILAPIVVLIAGIGGCEALKAYYDWRVREMCEKDGGVVVYERMTIDSEMFKKMKGDLGGVPVVPPESPKETDIPVYYRMTYKPSARASLRLEEPSF